MLSRDKPILSTNTEKVEERTRRNEGSASSSSKVRTEISATARGKMTKRQESVGGKYLSGGSTEERSDARKSDEEANSSTERKAMMKRSANSRLASELRDPRKASRMTDKEDGKAEKIRDTVGNQSNASTGDEVVLSKDIPILSMNTERLKKGQDEVKVVRAQARM